MDERIGHTASAAAGEPQLLPQLASLIERAALLDCLPAYDALITPSGTRVGRELIERGARLRVIARAGLAFINLDSPLPQAALVALRALPQASDVRARRL